MPRFIIAHRLAGRQNDSAQERSRVAAKNLVHEVRAFADIKSFGSESDRGRTVAFVEADASEMKAKAASFSADVIVEPEMMRVPARLFPSAAAAGPFDPAAMPAGSGATFKVTVQCEGAALPGAAVALRLTNVRTFAGSSVQGVTGQDGVATLPYDADFWTPTSVIVMPGSAAWSWLSAVSGTEIAFNLPVLPRIGPMGWWHYALNLSVPDEKRGEGIRIGIADDGLARHPYLAHVRNVGAFVNGKHEDAPDSGNAVGDHGTHVTGIVAARPPQNSGDFAGIAAGADVFCARVYPKPSPGSAQPPSASNGDIAIAIDALVTEHKVNLINLSLGGFQSSQVELDAIQAAVEVGVLVICSAGNENGGPVTYPAAYAQSIGVSAIGVPGCCPPNGLDASVTPSQSDRFSFTGAYSPTFTSIGPAINCVGPGVAIISTVPGTKDGSAPYAAMSGTSMAAPAVCAALATLLSSDRTYRDMPGDIHRAARAATLLLQGTRNLGLSPQYQGAGLPTAVG